MSINITNIGIVKTINKPWGYEKWIADGAPDFKYALKEIFFKTGNKSSIQFHQFKEETTYVLKGKGILHYSEIPINIEKYTADNYSTDDIDNLISNMKKLEINPGMIYHIKPGIIHQVESIEDLLFIESSTIELDDVVRFKDQWGRSNGKIETEHRKFLLPGNFYQSEVERIKFAKSYAKGKVLFCTHGVNTQFFCSKLLLNSESKEVFHHDSFYPNENLGIRKLNNNNSIDYEIGPKINEIQEKTFDCIVSFEEIQYRKNPLSVFKLYNSLLKDNGTLILSTINKDAMHQYMTTNETFGFNKEDLLEILKNFFLDISIFSQKIPSNFQSKQKSLTSIGNIFSVIRKSSKKILQTVDKNENFYKLHLQKSILKIRNTKEQLNDKIFENSYVPIPYEKSHMPLNFVLLCKKNDSA